MGALFNSYNPMSNSNYLPSSLDFTFASCLLQLESQLLSPEIISLTPGNLPSSRVINASHSAYMLLSRTTFFILDIPINLLVLFSPSVSMAEFRLFPIFFLHYSGLGWLFTCAQYLLFRYFGSQDTDPTVHNFSSKHRSYIYVHRI